MCPDGLVLQLGQRSSDRDVWLWVPSSTGHNQASPWSSPLALSHWRECNELHFISGLPPQGLQQSSDATARAWRKSHHPGSEGPAITSRRTSAGLPSSLAKT